MSDKAGLEKNKMNYEGNLINRRKALQGMLAVMATTGSGLAFAGMNPEHAHHAANKQQAVIDSALDCVKTGEACLDHCIELFKGGDTSVAECADTVNEMLAMCTALSRMASYRSHHLKDLARVCLEVCKDCEKECRKHADKHAECKACADSCKQCIKECKKIIA